MKRLTNASTIDNPIIRMDISLMQAKRETGSLKICPYARNEAQAVLYSATSRAERVISSCSTWASRSRGDHFFEKLNGVGHAVWIAEASRSLAGHLDVVVEVLR